MQCRILAAMLAAFLCLAPVSLALAADMTVAAANSTCPTLKKAGAIFSRQHAVHIHYICKSSGVLAKGLTTGHISADYFISASQEWLDYVKAAGLIDPGSVKALWANRIIAVVPKSSGLELQGWQDLATAKITTIYVGDPSTTPLGRKFKNAMVSQGLWEAIRAKIVTKRHLSLTREDLPGANDSTIGIMFPTSLDNTLTRILEMPQEWYQPVVYSDSPLVGAKNKEGSIAFQAFLRTAEIKDLFGQAGYVILP